MIRRFLSRLVVRAALLGVFAMLALAQGWFGAVLGWAAFAYLLWRAFPRVLADLRRLWSAGKKVRSTTARF